MNYRRAVLQDIPRLIEMRFSYLREDLGEIKSEMEKEIAKQLTHYLTDHLNRDLWVYAAEEGQIVATVFLIVVLKPASPSFLSGKTGIVLNVYTCPEYRRRGAAKALLNMAIKDAREENLAYIELKATEAGEALYRGLGFVTEDETYTAMKYKLKSSIE